MFHIFWTWFCQVVTVSLNTYIFYTVPGWEVGGKALMVLGSVSEMCIEVVVQLGYVPGLQYVEECHISLGINQKSPWFLHFSVFFYRFILTHELESQNFLFLIYKNCSEGSQSRIWETWILVWVLPLHYTLFVFWIIFHQWGHFWCEDARSEEGCYCMGCLDLIQSWNGNLKYIWRYLWLFMWKLLTHDFLYICMWVLIFTAQEFCCVVSNIISQCCGSKVLHLLKKF